MTHPGGRKEYLIKYMGILLLRHGRTLEQAREEMRGKGRWTIARLERHLEALRRRLEREEART